MSSVIWSASVTDASTSAVHCLCSSSSITNREAGSPLHSLLIQSEEVVDLTVCSLFKLSDGTLSWAEGCGLVAKKAVVMSARTLVRCVSVAESEALSTTLSFFPGFHRSKWSQFIPCNGTHEWSIVRRAVLCAAQKSPELSDGCLYRSNNLGLMAPASASFQTATKALEGMKDERPAQRQPVGMLRGRDVPWEGTFFRLLIKRSEDTLEKRVEGGYKKKGHVSSAEEWDKHRLQRNFLIKL